MVLVQECLRSNGWSKLWLVTDIAHTRAYHM